MKIEAIFFDIDGTLVSFDTHKIPQSTLDALRLLREKGIKLFIATGRHKAFIDNLGEEKFDAFITVNGQLCFNDKEIIHKQSIQPSDVENLVELLKLRDYACLFVGEKEFFLNRTNDVTDHLLDMLNFPLVPIRPAEDALDMNIYQLVSFVSAEQEADYMSVLPNCSPTRWYPTFIDVVPKGGSKQVGMDALFAYYGINRENTIAFGDGDNDIQMLQHAGIGVAMGNANDNVKEVADQVTDSVDENGIWNMLKKLNVI